MPPITIGNRPFWNGSLPLNQNGWIAEGLLAALFTGMALCILLFSWYPTTAMYIRWQNVGYWGISLFIVLVMLMIYWSIACYRKHCFGRGGQDHLLMRALMKTCLTKDCGEIERLLSVSRDPDIVIFNKMILCQLQVVIDAKVTRMQEIRTRFTESGIKRMNGFHLECLFHTPKSYAQLPLPNEHENVFKAIEPYESLMSFQIAEVKAWRQALFTLMSDYLELFSVTAADVEKLKRTYCFHPPEKSLAKNIVFANRAINYLKDYEIEKLSSEQKQFMENTACEKIEGLKSIVVSYHKAWINLVKAYDALPLNPKPSSKSVNFQ